MLGEKDRILVLFSREAGKVSAVAKGARRPGNQFSGASQPFCVGRFALARGRNLDVLTQCQVSETFHDLRLDVVRLACASCIVELTERATEERHEEPTLFDLLLLALHQLRTASDPETVLRWFDLRFLGLLGYEAELASCLSCGQPVAAKRSVFSAARGGVMCVGCAEVLAGNVPMTPELQAAVAVLQHCSPTDLVQFRLEPLVRFGLRRVLQEMCAHRLELSLRSEEFLAQVTEGLAVSPTGGEEAPSR